MLSSLRLCFKNRTCLHCIVDSTEIPFTEHAYSDSEEKKKTSSRIRHDVGGLLLRLTKHQRREKQTQKRNIEALIYKYFNVGKSVIVN